MTQHLVQTGRQDGFQMVGCFALGVTQFYKVIFSECSRQNAKDFFHQKVMLRTDLVCTCTVHMTTAKDGYTHSMRWNSLWNAIYEFHPCSHVQENI